MCLLRDQNEKQQIDIDKEKSLPDSAVAPKQRL